MERGALSILASAHILFGKPVSTFPGHALMLPFHARSRASKSGQNNSKRGKDEKRAACSGSDPELCSVPKRTKDDGQDT
jgi:hypothetical protein